MRASLCKRVHIPARFNQCDIQALRIAVALEMLSLNGIPVEGQTAALQCTDRHVRDDLPCPVVDHISDLALVQLVWNKVSKGPHC